MKLLNKVTFKCGINPAILKSLSVSVRELHTSDRVCSLLFDEMALEPSLIYSRKRDEAIGFVDTGKGKKLMFPDHVMVFMLRGIRKWWKQPIIGLRVIATVCDQHPVNVATITKLVEDTNSSYLRMGRDNRNLGFEIEGKKVVPFFDPPHLLKVVQNNLLVNKAKFTYKKQNKMASWADIISLYQLDVGDCNTRMCYKLTQGHIFK